MPRRKKEEVEIEIQAEEEIEEVVSDPYEVDSTLTMDILDFDPSRTPSCCSVGTFWTGGKQKVILSRKDK